MPETNAPTINSINDLFYYYEKMESSDVNVSSVEIALDDFLEHFKFILKYNDTLGRLHGTIDASLAASIVDLQEFVFDLYRRFKYQDQTVTLSEDEQNALRVYVKIADGSTEEIIENLKDITGVLFMDMTGKQKIIAMFVLSSVLTVGFVGSKYIDYLESSKKVEASTAEERLENERLQIVINGYSKVQAEVNSRPLYKEAIKNGQKALLKPVKQNNSYTVRPIDNLDELNTTVKGTYIVDAEKAKKILKTTRNTSATEIITDYFYIKYIEALEETHHYKIKLVSSSSEVYGLVEIDASDEDIDLNILSRHLANRHPAKLTVRTKTLNATTSVDKLIATLTTEEQ